MGKVGFTNVVDRCHERIGFQVCGESSFVFKAGCAIVSILENCRDWVNTIVATDYYSQRLYFCHIVEIRGSWGEEVQVRCVEETLR